MYIGRNFVTLIHHSKKKHTCSPYVCLHLELKATIAAVFDAIYTKRTSFPFFSQFFDFINSFWFFHHILTFSRYFDFSLFFHFCNIFEIFALTLFIYEKKNPFCVLLLFQIRQIYKKKVLTLGLNYRIPMYFDTLSLVPFPEFFLSVMVSVKWLKMC